jgi:hypothetical protein
MSVIRAEIKDENTCTALGITARAEAPVLKVCRLLVAAGHDPSLALHAYRGDVLCLKVLNIGEGARLQCGAAGFHFFEKVSPQAVKPSAERGAPA